MEAYEAVKVGRKELKLSDLYGRVIQNNLTPDDRFFLARIIEQWNHNPQLIFTETHYIDLKNPS